MNDTVVVFVKRFHAFMILLFFESVKEINYTETQIYVICANLQKHRNSSFQNSLLRNSRRNATRQWRHLLQPPTPFSAIFQIKQELEKIKNKNKDEKFGLPNKHRNNTFEIRAHDPSFDPDLPDSYSTGSSACAHLLSI